MPTTKLAVWLECGSSRYRRKSFDMCVKEEEEEEKTSRRKMEQYRLSNIVVKLGLELRRMFKIFRVLSLKTFL